jgi:hypothetical protein
MDARQRVGAALVIAGVALALVGAAGLVLNQGAPAVATASPTPAPSIAATQPALTTPPVTAPPATAPAPDVEALVRDFFEAFQAAVRDGSQEDFAANLGQATIDRYGLAACQVNLASKVPVPEQAFEIVEVSEPAPWDYVTDGETTSVPDTITVDARVTAPDPSGVVGTESRELHVQVIEGLVYWFTDCGEPLGRATR